MQELITIIITTFTPSFAKICVASLVFISFLFGNFYHDAILAVLMLMVIDTIFGIGATVAENKPITSRRFARTIHKSIVYLLAISAGYFLDTTLPFAVAQATMVGFVGTTEFISILENMGRMGYQTPKKLLNQLKEFRSEK